MRFTTDLPADYNGPVMLIRTRSIHVDKEATADTVAAGVFKMRLLMPAGFRKPSDDFHYRLIVADDWQYYYDNAKTNLKEWEWEYAEIDGKYVYVSHSPDDWQDVYKYLPANHTLKELT